MSQVHSDNFKNRARRDIEMSYLFFVELAVKSRPVVSEPILVDNGLMTFTGFSTGTPVRLMATEKAFPATPL